MTSTSEPALVAGKGDVATAAGAPSVLLSVREMSKAYGARVAVDSLSFEVHDGEFFTLLGPSGCGKSTTLMALAGFERIDGGTVVLGDRDITNERPERRDMGVVFQNYALFPHMTVLANVGFPLRMRGIVGAEGAKRAREALELVELEADRYDLRPGQLSGGQQQRVALARAMVFQPSVLLMDEPLSALDRRLRQNLQIQLRHLQARLNTTVIYVTHDQEEALTLSDRIAVMREGRFDQVARPRQIYGEPATAFVAGFIGNSNSASVRVDRRGPAIVEVRAAAGEGPLLRIPSARTMTGEDGGLLFVRPERIAVSDLAADETHDRCEAIVTDVAFLGDHVRLEVRLDLGDTWTVPVPIGESAGILDRARVGERVALRWAIDDAHLLAEE